MLLINSTNHGDIIEALQEAEVSTFHATNGTYAYPKEMIESTTLAGFQFLAEERAQDGDAFVIAVNSDVSMQGIMDAKQEALNIKEASLIQQRHRHETEEGASEEDVLALDKAFKDLAVAKEQLQKDVDNLEDQETRAMKVAHSLQANHPDRQVVVMYYDEPTPTPLYDALAESGAVTMKSLHKWGYGTDPDAPKIEGAHNFETVYGFPLPNDTKPLCHDLTAHEDQSAVVEVVKLNKYLDRVEHGRVLPAPTNTL